MIARPHRLALAVLFGVLAIWVVGMFALMRASALPPETTGKMLVVFEPGTTSEAAFAAITQAGASPIKQTSLGFIWVVSGNVAALEKAGALGAYRELPISPVIAGCVAVADAKIVDALSL
jgi:hypothetical protein